MEGTLFKFIYRYQRRMLRLPINNFLLDINLVLIRSLNNKLLHLYYILCQVVNYQLLLIIITNQYQVF